MANRSTKRYVMFIEVISYTMWNNNMVAMPIFQVYTVTSLFRNVLECSFSYTKLRSTLNTDYAELLQENVYNSAE
jgi:hypothetical protein